MYIDEAIKHAREIAEKNKRGANFKPLDSVDHDIKHSCEQCAREHDQLADWLEELKELRAKEQKIEKFIEDYDGAISISDNMGIISGQMLVDELKEIMQNQR